MFRARRAEVSMSHTPRPFSRHEWLIAWRFLRARRAEGGVSVMTIISLVGIALAVAALIITLAVRSGFRAEFQLPIVSGSSSNRVCLRTGTSLFSQVASFFRV